MATVFPILCSFKTDVLLINLLLLVFSFFADFSFQLQFY